MASYNYFCSTFQLNLSRVRYFLENLIIYRFEIKLTFYLLINSCSDQKTLSILKLLYSKIDIDPVEEK